MRDYERARRRDLYAAAIGLFILALMVLSWH